MTAAAAEPRARRDRLAILLSALVYPGSGQLVQRRWLAAAAFGATFTAAAVWFMVTALRILRAYYELAFRFEDPGLVVANCSPCRLLGPLAISLLVYLGSLSDTVAAQRRRGPPVGPPA